MSGSTRERGAAVIGLRTSHPVLSSLLYRMIRLGRLRSEHALGRGSSPMNPQEEFTTKVTKDTKMPMTRDKAAAP